MHVGYQTIFIPTKYETAEKHTFYKQYVEFEPKTA